MDDLLLRALAAGVIVAAMLGPLGAIVVWRRMAYFGDTIAHASLLGVALSLLSHGAVPMMFALPAVALVVAWFLSALARDAHLSHDTLLGILAHAALALGIVLIALQPDARPNLEAYLFGDILTVGWNDVAMLAALALGVAIFLMWQWRNVLIATIHPAIARTQGVNVARTELCLTLVLAMVIALAVKITGMLLITALLVIPPAAARAFSRSPLQMAILASLLGMISVWVGLYGSYQLDTPTGPSMVVVATALFAASRVMGYKR